MLLPRHGPNRRLYGLRPHRSLAPSLIASRARRSPRRIPASSRHDARVTERSDRGVPAFVCRSHAFPVRRRLSRPGAAPEWIGAPRPLLPELSAGLFHGLM
ncbi:hypothetical protein STAFG_5990 [Streptomyces afghaniensis 772]|uniref:Uncharacterized protein n=1 Tax=Streptomyces afghaniensis 772 TaxID=1283301 RepID=S4NF02_9ACTN|nr:hypothetical protein STAFG_5990 [Streptomyces afghaniensis 772]